MNYLTQYYKNLCEQLEEKVNLLEAGLKRALQTGDNERLRKEALRQGARWDRAREEAVESRGKGLKAVRKYGPTSHEAGVHNWKAMVADTQAQNIMKNIVAIDQQLDAQAPNVRAVSSKKYINTSNLPPDEFPERPIGDLSPDAFDGSDPGTKGSSEEVGLAQKINQFTGNLQGGDDDEWIPHPGNPKVQIRPWPEY